MHTCKHTERRGKEMNTHTHTLTLSLPRTQIKDRNSQSVNRSERHDTFFWKGDTEASDEGVRETAGLALGDAFTDYKTEQCQEILFGLHPERNGDKKREPDRERETCVHVYPKCHPLMPPCPTADIPSLV